VRGASPFPPSGAWRASTSSPDRPPAGTTSPPWLRDARTRDASYPEHLPEHWTAIADRRRLLRYVDDLLLNQRISAAANSTTFDLDDPPPVDDDF
jgi:hypothetical protein